MKWPGWWSASAELHQLQSSARQCVDLHLFRGARAADPNLLPLSAGRAFRQQKIRHVHLDDKSAWEAPICGLVRHREHEGAMSTTESNIRVEDLGDFHDAELTSLTLDRTAGRVLLVFSKDDGTDGQLECKGVLNIKCSTLLFQNVVSRLRVAPILALPAEEVRQIIAWSFTLDDRMAISTGRLDTHVDNVMSGKLKLLHVDPSWGAEVAILCDAISFHRP
jgi:hypothetical protein